MSACSGGETKIKSRIPEDVATLDRASRALSARSLAGPPPRALNPPVSRRGRRCEWPGLVAVPSRDCDRGQRCPDSKPWRGVDRHTRSRALAHAVEAAAYRSRCANRVGPSSWQETATQGQGATATRHCGDTRRQVPLEVRRAGHEASRDHEDRSVQAGPLRGEPLEAGFILGETS